MAVDDVAKALMVIDDEEARNAVSGGDPAPLSGLDLNDEERELVLAAVSEDSEVEGFEYDESNYFRAFTYVSLNQVSLSADVRTDFSRFIEMRFEGDASIRAFIWHPDPGFEGRPTSS